MGKFLKGLIVLSLSISTHSLTTNISYSEELLPTDAEKNELEETGVTSLDGINPNTEEEGLYCPDGTTPNADGTGCVPSIVEPASNTATPEDIRSNVTKCEKTERLVTSSFGTYCVPLTEQELRDKNNEETVTSEDSTPSNCDLAGDPGLQAECEAKLNENTSNNKSNQTSSNCNFPGDPGLEAECRERSNNNDQTTVTPDQKPAPEMNKMADQRTACAKQAEETGRCCSPDPGASGCGKPEVSAIMQMGNQLSAMVAQVKSSSIAGTCADQSEATRIQQALIAASTAMCGNQAKDCYSACSFTGDCTALPEESRDRTNCETWQKEMRSNKISCMATGGSITMASVAQLYGMRELEKAAEECRKQVAANQQCNDDEYAISNPLECDVRSVCSKPEYAGHPSCENLPNLDDDTGSVSLATNVDNADPNLGDGGLGNLDDCSQSLEGCDDTEYEGSAGLGAPSAGGGGSDGGAPGGGAIPGSGSVSSASSSGGGSSGSAGSGSGRSIIKGTSSGSGFVSRFRGGGGGSYRNSVSRGRTPASTKGAGLPSFNLKKFLPKSKRIQKGKFKNYHRLPSGKLMAPQSFDIFKIHHQSYKSACLNNKAIRGCEPKNIKQLGKKASLRDVNSVYRAQLFLPKELNHQRANQAGVKVKPLKSENNKNARKTYYQLQYMNKHKISSLPFNYNSQSPARMSSNPAELQKVNAMKSWVNAQTNKSLNPAQQKSSNRMPASK